VLLRRLLEPGQYASEAYRARLAEAGITSSMSRRGDCLDNAVAESFFSTLKIELVYRTGWHTRAEARCDVHESIEVFYNRRRSHSTLGYCTPVEFEKTRRSCSQRSLQGGTGAPPRTP
jgi:putative transposase